MPGYPPPVVLAISRQLGSGGGVIGRTVARALGVPCLDREILVRAARELSVESEESLAPLEECCQTFWSRVARGLAVGPPDAHVSPLQTAAVDEAALFAVEGRIIEEIACREDVVIIGRGAVHILSGRPGVLRVFVHAGEAARVAEVQRANGVGRSEAQALVRRSDLQRAKFVHALTRCAWTDARLYDLTIDTSVVHPEEAAVFVSDLMRPRMHLKRAALPVPAGIPTES